MLIRQLFDQKSCTYTYLLADEESREAVLIDTVVEKLDDYHRLVQELDLKLLYTLETHTHADHITAAGDIREQLGAASLVGRQSLANCVSATFEHGDEITFGQHKLKVIYTPGHTDDSYSFFIPGPQAMLFSGDTLLIRGTGRTDFQGGDARRQYHSLQSEILVLPEDTLVYPGHDYKGWSVSTIGEERRCNPRLLLGSEDAYIAHMSELNLPNPKMMDVAVPANQQCGKRPFVDPGF